MVEYYWDGENWLKVYKNNKFIEYYLGDKLHRNDGPASIKFACLGKHFIRSHKYYKNGKLHREGSPAFITYYWNGSVEFEFYYFNDILHRINGPSIIFYNNDGFIESEFYYTNGKLHREDDPAKIWYDEFENITNKEYWFKGIEFDPEILLFEMPIDTEEKEFMFKLIYGE